MKTKKSTTPEFISEDLEKQRAYVQRKKAEGGHFPLIATEAFVRGMRDSGYKSTATAIDEFIDNSIQAQAEFVDIVIGYPATNPTQKKIDEESGGYIAIVDNGHGMDPEMIQFAVMWGGTHRENDRSGFGRYGFGLPSAAVSISRTFEVFSKVPGGEWASVRIDLKAIADGRLRNDDGIVEAPEPTKAEIPAFIRRVLPGGDLPHGTIILLDTCDRLTPGYVQVEKFKENLMHEVGLTYRDVLRSVRMRVVDVGATVDITEIEPIDPLFLRDDARYYDENEERAIALPSMEIPVKSAASREKMAGAMRVRFSWMKPGFMAKSTARLKVRAKNAGLLVMRAGRQVDVIDKFPPKWGLSLQHNDRYWAAELDFDPALDELFGVTTNKQQITITENIWEILKAAGFVSAVKEMRRLYKEENDKLDAKGQPEEKRSEKVAAETLKFRRRRAPQSPAKEKRSKENLDTEAERVAKETGRPADDVKKEIGEKPYKIDYETMPGAPFYRMVQYGSQKRLFINTAHRFYTDIYNADTSRRVQEGLELLLLVLGECEVDAPDEREQFYKMERNEWSRVLESMLERLDQEDPIIDRQSARAADVEQADAEALAAAK
jgi:Histidine kinase-, DNA gyrase B-, and HSP90-like ATPase